MAKLERLTYVCLITLSLISAWILVKRGWIAHTARNSSNTPVTLVGKKLDVPGIPWNSSKISAVVFLSTECRYCEASMPFYRRLVTAHHLSPNSKVSLSALSLEPSEYVTDHLASENVRFDHVYHIPHVNKLLRGTPTFLIVDENGVVERAAFGELTPSKEDEMLQIVKAGTLNPDHSHKEDLTAR